MGSEAVLHRVKLITVKVQPLSERLPRQNKQARVDERGTHIAVLTRRISMWQVALSLRALSAAP